MTKLIPHCDMEGLFLVNFSYPVEVNTRGNSLLPAIVVPYKGPTLPKDRLEIIWLNGNRCVIHPDKINVYQLNQK